MSKESWVRWCANMYKYRPCHFPLDGIHVHVRLLEPALQLHYPWTRLNKFEQLENGNAMECWRFPTAALGDIRNFYRSTFWSWERSIMSVSLPWHIQKTQSFHRCTKQLAEWLMSTSCRSPFSMPSSVSKWTLSLQMASILMQKGGRTSRLHIDHIVDWMCDFIFSPYNEIDDVRGFPFNCWRSKQVAWREDSASLWPSASCGISSLAPNRHYAGGPAKPGACTYSNTSNNYCILYINLVSYDHSNPSPINLLRDFAKSSILWKLPVAQYFWHLLTFTMVA